MKSNEQFKALFNQSHDAVFLLDLAGNHIAANIQASTMFGYTEQELLVLSYKDLSAELVQSESMLCRLKKGEKLPLYERQFKTKSGAIIIGEISLALVYDQNGNPMHIQSVVRNVSDKKWDEKKIRELLAEKELILREVHHRITNNMLTIMSIISLQVASTHNAETISALRDTHERMHSMAVLYDKIYRSEGVQKTNAKDYLETLIREIVLIFPEKNVQLIIDLDNIDLGVKLLSSIGIIINELITNSMKYAFTVDRNNVLTINMKKTGAQLSLTVQDNGEGFPAGFDPEHSTGFGMILLHALCQQLDGQLLIESRGGAVFKLILSDTTVP